MGHSSGLYDEKLDITILINIWSIGYRDLPVIYSVLGICRISHYSGIYISLLYISLLRISLLITHYSLLLLTTIISLLRISHYSRFLGLGKIINPSKFPF